MLKRLFKLQEHQSTVGRELAAGVTTFLTMGYIIFVNPDILSATGMDKGAVITVTILASALGTIMAGLWANVPFAMAPGMGLNAFFAFTLVLSKGVSWETALGVVFVSGVVFLLLTLLGVRRYVIAAIPMEMRLAIAAGIGLFITFIGFQKLGLIVNNDAVLVGIGKLNSTVILGLIGLLLIAVLEIRKVRGAILISIIFTTVLGLIFGEVPMPGSVISAPPSPAPVFLKMDILGALHWGMMGAVFTFMFVDLFDSVGTIVACSYEADLVKKDGSIDRIDRVLEADAVATVAGSLMGTSTTTTYIESGAGIAAGGRTGLANMATGLLFLIALFFTPLISLVPSFATAPALIIVGVYMFRNVGQVDFRRLEIGIPAFLTIILMPLTYSISIGLAFGFVAYIVGMVAVGKIKDVHPFLWAIGAISILDIALTAGH
ncbi:MAG: guanine permease [Planctomycetota bacterium]|nr:MAG: guanine permease [Planctomycetota bacterium]